MKNNIVITQEWESKLISRMCNMIRDSKFVGNTTAILQLSSEYSGIMGQLFAHKLGDEGAPLNVEVINIPYKQEFKVNIHPNILDGYDKFIVLDSGCLSGNNFKNVCNILLDYGFKRTDLLFCSVVCSLQSVFIPDVSLVYFDGDLDMIHFWWETKTTHFD